MSSDNNNARRPDPPDADELLANYVHDRFRIGSKKEAELPPKRPNTADHHDSNLVMRPPVRSTSVVDRSRDLDKDGSFSGEQHGRSSNKQMALGNFFDKTTAKLTKVVEADSDVNSRGAYSTVSKMRQAKSRKSAKTTGNGSSSTKSRCDKPSGNESSLSKTTIKEFSCMEKLDRILDRKSSHSRLESGVLSRSTAASTSKMKASGSRRSLTTSPKPGSPSTTPLSSSGSSRNVHSTPQTSGSSGSCLSSDRPSPCDLTSPSAAPTKPTRRISNYDPDQHPSTPSISKRRTTASTTPQRASDGSRRKSDLSQIAAKLEEECRRGSTSNRMKKGSCEDGNRRRHLQLETNQVASICEEEIPRASASIRMSKSSRQSSKKRVSSINSPEQQHRSRSSSRGSEDDDDDADLLCSDPSLPTEEDFVEATRRPYSSSCDRDREPSTLSSTSQSRTTDSTPSRKDGSRRSWQPGPNQTNAISEEVLKGSTSAKVKKSSHESSASSKRRVSATITPQGHHNRNQSHGGSEDEKADSSPLSDPPLPTGEEDFVELQKVAAAAAKSASSSKPRNRGRDSSGSSPSKVTSRPPVTESGRLVSDSIEDVIASKSPHRSGDVMVTSRYISRDSSNGGEAAVNRPSRRSSNGEGNFNMISSGTRRISMTGSTWDGNGENRRLPSVSRQNVADPEDSEVTTGQDKLKTSHLRRLIDPSQRLSRNNSHNSGFSGGRSSITSAVSSVEEDKSSRNGRGPRCPRRVDSDRAPSWRPPSSRRIFVDDDTAKQGDSAPRSPQRRCSVVTTSRRRSSVASSRHSSISSFSSQRLSKIVSSESEEPDDYDDVSVSERIQEEEDEDSSSFDSDDEMQLLDLDVDGEEDIFTSYSWSTDRQDPERIQKERKRLRDTIRDSPLYRAYESSRKP